MNAIKIKNDQDMKFWLITLHAMPNFSRATEVKREIRKYQKQTNDFTLVHSTCDEMIRLEPLPLELQTPEEAEQYFAEYCEIPKEWSWYDCTGRSFTAWHKIITRHNRFYVYHCIRFDI